MCAGGHFLSFNYRFGSGAVDAFGQGFSAAVRSFSCSGERLILGTEFRCRGPLLDCDGRWQKPATVTSSRRVLLPSSISVITLGIEFVLHRKHAGTVYLSAVQLQSSTAPFCSISRCHVKKPVAIHFGAFLRITLRNVEILILLLPHLSGIHRRCDNRRHCRDLYHPTLIQGQPAGFSANESARSFIRVFEPFGGGNPSRNAMFRTRTSQSIWRFNIVVDDRPGQPCQRPTSDEGQGGGAVIAFTLRAIADARNEDELAFVMGHGSSPTTSKANIARQQQNAVAGCECLCRSCHTQLGRRSNCGQNRRSDLGQQVGARDIQRISSLMAELWAPSFHARAGYNSLRGPNSFTRIPDPATVSSELTAQCRRGLDYGAPKTARGCNDT